MSGYISWIRQRVGHDPIILNASAALIINDAGEILCLRRGDRAEEVWGLPGGMLEVGESAEEAMLREVREETGLEVAVERFLGVYTKDRMDTYPNGDTAHVILFVFVCRATGGQLRADGTEAAELRYFSPAGVPASFRHQTVLRDYMEGAAGVVR